MQPINRIICTISPRKLKFSTDGSLLLAVGFKIDGFLESSNNRSEIIVYNLRDQSKSLHIRTEDIVLDASFLNCEQIVAAIKTADPVETRKTLAIYDIK